jgi:hypothetical protein
MFKGVDFARRKALRTAALPLVLVSLILSGLALMIAGSAHAQTLDFADPSFLAQWQLADKPVQDGSVTNRSWVWGPAFSDGKTEDYAQSPNGKRLVQYFDKARMEINNPDQPRGNKYFVTNGLLVTEMISGQVQTGDASFTANPAGPAQIPVAGDPSGNGVALLYSSFRPVASIDGGNRSNDLTAQVVINTLSKDGVAGQNDATGGYNVKNAYYESTLGHNIPDVFWKFLNQQGPVLVNGNLRNGMILEWQVAAGLPLSEAYWSRAVVGGQEKDVLVQMFQRRVLTYTPSNNDPYKVEMGNVGQHYYRWRYENLPDTGGQPAPTPTQPPAPQPTPTPPPEPTIPPAPANWSAPREVVAVARPVVRVRPTDGAIWVVGENKANKGVFASGSDSNFGNVLNLEPGGKGGEKASASFDSQGNLHVVWQSRNPDAGGSFQTYYRRVNANGSLGPLRDLSTELIGNGPSGIPYIYFNLATNQLYLVHEENPQIVAFFESGDFGATWGNRKVISTDNKTQTVPRVIGDAQGNVHVLWLRNTGGGYNDIMAMSRIGNDWTGAYNVTNYNRSWSVPSPEVGVGSNGDVYLTWISPAAGNGAGIGFARYDAASRQWQPRVDDITRAPANLGSIKGTKIGRTSNGALWIGYSVGNPGNSSHEGAFAVTSNDNGANWSGVATIFKNTGPDALDLYAFGSNVYYAGVFERRTYVSYRGQ